MGVDSEAEDISNAAFNGDALMLITFNPKTLSTTILSIPRDSYVPIACFPGQKRNKITHAAWYGETCMIDTIENLFDIPIDYYQLISGESILTPQQQYKMRNNKNIEFEPPYEFAYAYAITVWKAQGSEWNKVLAFEEGHPFDKKEHLQYLYTACTRASEKLVLITKSS